jgi:hypothetical protein
MAIEEENITNTRLNFIINSYHTPEEIKALTEQVSALGTLDIAIASLGGWYHGEPYTIYLCRIGIRC